MNAYMIAGTAVTVTALVVHDRGRILRDIMTLIMILALHVWMGFIALVVAPIAMLVMTVIAPLLRALGAVDKAYSPAASAMTFVMTHTIPGQRGSRHDA